MFYTMRSMAYDDDGIDDVSMKVHVLGVQRKGFPATYAETDFFLVIKFAPDGREETKSPFGPPTKGKAR